MPSVSLSRSLDWNRFFYSSSGRTVLVAQRFPDGMHYQILDADSLDPKYAWTAEADAPEIVCISDDALLGLGHNGSLFLRSFSGSWRPFSGHLDWAAGYQAINKTPIRGSYLGPVVFLGNDSILGLSRSQKDTEQKVSLISAGGTTTPVAIPKLPKRTWLSGLVFVADSGRYFALGFRHQSWLYQATARALDMAFPNESTICVVWRASDLVPVTKIKMGANPRVLSCSPVGNPFVFAFIANGQLKVVKLLSK
jgi:hypothetical protein